MTETVPVNETGTHIRWDKVPFNPQHDMDDAWIAIVNGWDPETEYQWDYNFLDNITKNQQVYIQITQLSQGQTIAMKDGVGTRFYTVESAGHKTLELSEITRGDAIRSVGGDPENEDLDMTGLKEIDIRMTGDPAKLSDAIEEVEYILEDAGFEVSFADQMYEVSDRDAYRVYGDMNLPNRFNKDC